MKSVLVALNGVIVGLTGMVVFPFWLGGFVSAS